MTGPNSHGPSSSCRYAFGLKEGMDWICIHDASASICISEVYVAHSYYVYEGLDD